MYDAREIAMERMQAEAEKLEANLVLEFELTQKAYNWDTPPSFFRPHVWHHPSSHRLRINSSI
ncbi:MAG: hypothetical protein ACQR33_04840 [Candidatus Saccharibacteria bacterium]